MSLTTTPTVSVVIPCYNYGRYLVQALSSVLAQPGVDLDVIIVDDCSTDGSGEVAVAAAAEDPRVRVVLHGENQGHISTYNDGLTRVRGKYVVLLSADDLLAPGSLERSAALMEHDCSVGLVYGYAANFLHAPPPGSTRVTSWSIWSGEQWLKRMCVRGSNIIVNPEAMLRQSLMQELVGYDATLPHAADMDLWVRAASRSAVGRVNGPEQAYYRLHVSNMHATEYAGLLTDMVERRKVFDKLLDCDGATRGRTRSHVARAHRALAVEAMRAACLALDADGRHGGADAREFADFAVQCFPGVRRSLRWRVYEARVRRPAGWLRRQFSARTDALRWKFRWRRWRRFGT